MKCVITGCNRGVGAGIARTLINQRHHVYGINRTRTVDFHLDRYEEYIHDLSMPERLEEDFLETRRSIGADLDMIVLNAGVRALKPISQLTYSDWSQSFSVNVISQALILKSLIPQLKKGGRIIFIGSHAAEYEFPKGAAYSSSKSALFMLAKTTLKEVRDEGKYVTYFSLGAIKNRDHGYDETWKLLPEDIGEAILSLQSLNERVLPFYIEMRPSRPKPGLFNCMEDLQVI